MDRETMLEDMVRRLSDELSKYQAAAGRSVDASREKGIFYGVSKNAPLPDWMSDASVLTPLLQAYDDELASKQGALEHCRTNIESLQRKFDTIIKENSELGDELERANLRLSYVETQNEEVKNAELKVMSYSSSVRLNEETSLLARENDMLVEQQREYEGLIKQQNDELERITESIIDLRAANEELDSSRQMLLKEGGNMKNDIVKAQATIAQLEHSLRVRTRTLEEVMANGDPNSVHIAKQKLEEVKADFEGRLQALTLDNRELTLQLQKMRKSWQDSQVEGERAKSLLRTANADASTCRSEADGFRTVAIELEAKVHALQVKEADLVKKMNLYYDEGAKASLGMEENLNQLKARDTEIAELRERLSQQRVQLILAKEDELDRVRGRLSSQLDETTAICQSLQDQNTNLVGAKERLERDLQSMQGQVDALHKAAVAATFDENHESSLKFIEDQARTISTLSRQRDEAEERAASTEMSLERDKNLWEREKAALEAQTEELTSSSRKMKEENEKLSVEINKAKRQSDDASRDLRTSRREQQHLMDSLKANADASALQQSEKIMSLQTRLQRVIDAKQDSEAEASTTLRQTDMANMKYRAELERLSIKTEQERKTSNERVGWLTDINNQLKADIAILSTRCKELEASLLKYKEDMCRLEPLALHSKQSEEQLREKYFQIMEERDSLTCERRSLMDKIDEQDMILARLERQKKAAEEKANIVYNSIRKVQGGLHGHGQIPKLLLQT